MIWFPVDVVLYKKGGYTGWRKVRTLLVNMSTFGSQSNITKWVNTFVYDGASLILACNGPRTPGPRALAWFLTYSHIFASTSHQNKKFTYIEMPSSTLSYYVHFILLCRLPPMRARLVCGIIDVGADWGYQIIHNTKNPQEFTWRAPCLLTNHTQRLGGTLATPRGRLFSILGNNVTFALLAVWDSFFSLFFVVWSMQWWGSWMIGE